MRTTVESSQKTKATAPTANTSSTTTPAGLLKAEATPLLKLSPSEAA